MRCTRVLLVVMLLSSVTPTRPQTFPAPDYLRKLMYGPALPSQVPGPEGLRDCVKDGKLRLSLEDAIRLTLANNTDVRLERLRIEESTFALQRAFLPFDPTTVSSFNATRSLSPSVTKLAGAPTASSLGQQAQFSYSQAFQTGTSTSIQFSGNKSDTNSSFATFNPSIGASLSFNVTQPLLRNRGFFPNRAPIVIAQRNLKQSRANFEAQVNLGIEQAVGQYWDVVQARENLNVQQKSLEEADASYKLDKRKLELGALPPLDIYRSESEVASRRVQVIHAEYALKQAEDALRRTIGADLDINIRAFDLDLVDKAEPSGDLVTMDVPEALKRAFERRPELEALRQQLANDDTSIRVAHNGLLPDLSLSGLYSSSGRGGNQIDTTTTPPTLVSTGGLTDALSQVRAFDFPTYGFTLQLRLPIRNRAAQADLGNALVAKRRGLYQLRQEEQAIQLEITNAIHQLEEAKLSLGAARIAADTAQKTLEAEQRKYELGAETIFFVLQAQTALAQAQLSQLQSEIAYQKSVAAVQRATGTLLEKHNLKLAE